MNAPFLKLTQTEEGWQALFAFQVFHRKGEDWLKMRWGFNAGALLDEALDRYKLFIESQTINEAEYHTGTQPNHTLALRGINLPEIGTQMALLGKASAKEKEDAKRAGINFARELYSTFPHDFLLIPAELPEDYNRLTGTDIATTNSSVAQIQRGIAYVPLALSSRYFSSLWQASSRSNEQIWRSLSAMPNQIIFNVMIQPTVFYDGERQSMLAIKNHISKTEQNTDLTSAYIPWAENYIKRRLAAWKKFFLMQVHVIANGDLAGNILRSIGSALTRDAIDLPLPGYQIKWPDSTDTNQIWCEKILAMELIPSTRVEDLVDSDEVFAVFRFPYLPEAGLPGAKFIAMQKDIPPAQNGQEQ